MTRPALSQTNREPRKQASFSELDKLLCTYDIETSARIALFFGNQYKARIAKVVQEMYVFGFSYKPFKKKVQSCYIWDFPLYKKDPTNDIEVVRKWLELRNKYPVLIGQNSRQFDDKIMMGRAIMHGLTPPVPGQSIDTKSDLQRVARYDENGLDWVSKQYGDGGKVDTGGIDLWWDCMDVPGFKKGDPKAQKKMVRYCENDVIKTEKKYLRERPFYKSHPALNVLTKRPDSCPTCAEGPMKPGQIYHSTKVGLYQYFTCMACGTRCKSRTPEYQNAHEKVKVVK